MSPSRVYASAGAFKMALEARIRARANRTGESIDRVRTLFVLDRLAVRLASEFGDQVLIKGGMAMHYRTQDCRLTRDLDVRAEPGIRADSLDRLRAAGERDLGDFLRFAVQENARHPKIQGDGIPHEGRRYRVTPYLAGKIYAQVVGLDVAIGDVFYGDPQTVPSSDFVAFAGLPPRPLALYPRETHVAEKLHAYTQPRASTNQRVKDLPDLAILAKTERFEARRLRDALEQTYSSRGSHRLPTEVPDPPPAWSAPYEAMARAEKLPWTDLPAVLAAVRAFLNPVLAGESGAWDPERFGWESADEVQTSGPDEVS